MRRLLFAPLILLLLACGGTTRNGQPSPSPGGAAGQPSAAAGMSNLAAVAGGAASAGSPGGQSEGGGSHAAGAAGAEASTAGAAGQAGSPACTGLDCLAGAELLYVPDREWQRPAAGGGMSELDEADYEPLLGPTWRAKFSSDALTVDLTPSAGGDTVHGTRDPKRAAGAWFELQLFAGGRFLVTPSSSELRAEHTIYGSGMPILSSTRGLLESP